MIFYLHGFNSSPASGKALLLAEHCARAGIKCKVPQLPDRPAEAINLVVRECAEAGEEVLLVGSSMGGYYATWLVENKNCSAAVLVNPAIRLAAKLTEQVNQVQRNHHDGSEYLFTSDHERELRELEVAAIAEPARYLLLVQQGDEVLDYREAVTYYAGCQQIVEEGGDHGFVGFERHLPRLVTLHRELLQPQLN